MQVLVWYFRILAPSSLSRLLNEMLLRLFMKGMMWAGRRRGLDRSLELLMILTFSSAVFRQRICQYLGLLSFTIDIYLYYLFV